MSITHSTSTVPVLDEVVAIVAKIGGAVTTGELEYQLRRRGHTITQADVIDALYQAEAQGLVTPLTWTLGTQAPTMTARHSQPPGPPVPKLSGAAVRTVPA